MNQLFIHWSPSPVAFTFFHSEIRWYGVMFAFGLLIAYVITALIFRREKMEVYLVNFLLILGMLSVAIFGRLAHVFFYDWAYYSNHMGEILKPWEGGLASHGAAFGIIFFFFLFAKFVLKKPFLWLADRIVPAIAFASACVRIGNLFNSEIVGKKTDLPFGFIFTRVDLFPRHAIQLYEALVYFILCTVLLYLIYRKNFLLKQGLLSAIFLFSMFGSRFFLEFLKEDFKGVAEGWWINMGQILSVPFIIIGIWIVIDLSQMKLKDSKSEIHS